MTWTVFTAEQFSGDLHETPEALPIWVALADLGGMDLQENVGAAIAQALEVLGRTQVGGAAGLVEAAFPTLEVR